MQKVITLLVICLILPGCGNADKINDLWNKVDDLDYELEMMVHDGTPRGWVNHLKQTIANRKQMIRTLKEIQRLDPKAEHDGGVDGEATSVELFLWLAESDIIHSENLLPSWEDRVR